MTAASTAAFTLCELRQMRAGTPEELLSAMRWTHVALLGLLVSTAWFVTFYLGAGRRWLAWTFSGLRVFYLLVAFLIWGNVNYLEITSLRRVPFLGDSVTVFEGIPNPWMRFGYATMLLILVFVADASITAWRRGERRKALMIGGSVEFFLLLGTVEAALVHWAELPIPVLIGPLYLGLVVVMASELSRDVLRASRLVHELQASEAGLRESEARMSLAVDAADLGIWIRDLARNEIWASHKWRELFGFAPSEPLEFNAILQRLHPDDREGLRQAHAMAVAGADGGKYQTEYRLMLPDGATRWISSQGRVEFDAAGQPVLIRGAARDVTARKQAEQETQLLRQEIAHAGRVSMMGQLASGLAHEINQPLASILRNAEAAELFLQHPSPDLDEIRAILSDIRSDDERAGHVIDRMRGLLKRQTLDTRTARRGRAGRRCGGARAGRCRDAAGEAGCRCASRSAARSRRPRADSASAAQPHSQRDGRAQRDEARGSARLGDRAGRRRRARSSSRSPSATRGTAFLPTRLRGSSTRFSRPSRTAWA